MRHRDRANMNIFILLLCLGLSGGHAFAAERQEIMEGSKVTFVYKITAPDSAPVADKGEFVQGRHQLLPALEREVAGMRPGEEKQVQLTVEEGFGPYDDKKQRSVSPQELPLGVKEGSIVADRAGNVATVRELSSSAAVLDYNHPLAGKPLIVQIKILKVENPS